MSDFLTHITAKTLNATPVIQPRRASRFEPMQIPGVLGLGESAEEGALERASGSERTEMTGLKSENPAPVRPADQSQISHRTVTAMPTPSTSHNVETQVPPRTAQVQPVPSTQPQFIQPSSHVPRNAVPTNMEDHPTARTLTPSVSASTVMPAPTQSLVAAPVPAIHIEPVSKPDTATAHQDESPSVTVLKPVVERVVVERPNRANDAIARPTGIVAQPRVILSKPEVQTRAEPGPAPTINVTIGRIEVRAALLPAPSSKPKRAAQAMSLDEYLRRRAGGGAR